MEGTLQLYKQQGYARLLVNGKMQRIDQTKPTTKDRVFLIVDRIVVATDEDFYNRLAESVETAFYEGKWPTIRLQPSR